MNEKQKEKYAKAKAEAVEKLKAYDNLPELTGPAVPGDQYFIPNNTGVTAVVLYSHPDDANTLFVVPGDWINETLVGTLDVAVPEDGLFEAVTLRCGIGNWISRQGLESCKRHKLRIQPEFIKQGRKLLADLVRGNSIPKGRSDDDPELWEWSEEIEHDMEESLSTLDGIRPL